MGAGRLLVEQAAGLWEAGAGGLLVERAVGEAGAGRLLVEQAVGRLELVGEALET